MCSEIRLIQVEVGDIQHKNKLTPYLGRELRGVVYRFEPLLLVQSVERQKVLTSWGFPSLKSNGHKLVQFRPLCGLHLRFNKQIITSLLCLLLPARNFPK